MATRAAGTHRLSRAMDLSGVRLAPARRRSGRAVEAFWSWWSAGGARRCALALERGDERRVVPELTSLVEAIDPGLAWEFGSGSGARHRLTVTAAGEPELRGPARRWLECAPPADDTWEFADLREAVDGRAMWFRDRRLGFDDAEVVVDLGLSVADVTVHHPEFDAFGPEDRRLAAYLLLDAVCGEEAVELWVGGVHADAMAPGTDARPLRALPGMLLELARDNVDEDGGPAWQILQGSTPDGPMVAMVRVPLVALSAPEFDRHVAVDVAYTDVEECGLPGPASLPELRDLEDHLAGRVAGVGECVGAESCAGHRLLHFYVDSSSPAAEQLRAATAGWTQGPVTVESVDDPGWARVRHLRV